MKTKNMRKKALVASLAMLLVAVVALSGATYAWFSANSAATLGSVDFTTESQSSLLIAVTDATASAPAASEYSAAITIANDAWNMQLQPRSSIGAGGFYTCTASSVKADGELQTVESFAGSQTTGFLHKKVWFKSDADCQVRLSSLTSATQASSIAAAVRVSLVGDSTPTVYSLGSADEYYAVTGETGYTPGSITYGELYTGTAEKGVNYQRVTTITAGDTSNSFVSLSAGQVESVDLYVWLEGNDSACNNTIAGLTLNDLAFTFARVGG